MKRRFACLACVAVMMGLLMAVYTRAEDKAGKSQGSIFEKQKLVAWCIVPFDSKMRGPAARAEMLVKLGIKRVAYDWRAKDIPTFEEEILQYKKHDLEYFAFWDWHDSMTPLIKKHGIKPQVWIIARSPAEGTQQEKIAASAQSIMHLVKTTKELGLKLGIYNHGGWSGEPENMVAVCKYLREKHDADHVGLAGTIQEESGAKVYCHVKDSPLVEKDPSALAELLHIVEKRFIEWHVPPAKLDPLIDVLKLGHRLGGPPPRTTDFDAGDQIECENYSFSILHVPGHTLGLSCFLLNETNIAFVGDAVLPVYTPNIGGADLRVTSSLSQFRDGLLQLKNHNLDIFYPGHRHKILEPNLRIDEILQHHRDRLDQIVSLLTNPTDIWNLSTRIFGQLDGIHALYGSGEIFAHLEYLESMNLVTSSDGLYSLTAPSVDISTIF